MDSAALISLALKTLNCTQKELALRLRVSEGQISKWKAGEYISHDMDERLRKLARIKPFQDATLVLAVGAKDAAKWDKLIARLAKEAAEAAETGYNTVPLTGDDEFEASLLVSNTFEVLRDMGVAMPTDFPAELQQFIENAADDDGDIEAQWETVEQNPHAGLIHKIYLAFNDVYAFYAAYVDDLTDDDEVSEAAGTAAENIEPCLLGLAASKIEDVDPTIAPRFGEFVVKTEKDYRKWLLTLKRCAIRAGVPLKAEIMDLVYEHHDSLGHTAEAESFGFNDGKPHPDIYMNELVTGMRAIHQVLPAIIKKLGMTEADFTLDQSELSLFHWRHREAAADAKEGGAAGSTPVAADAPEADGGV